MGVATCASCGEAYDPTDRPECAVSGRLCKPADPLGELPAGDVELPGSSDESSEEHDETLGTLGDTPATGPDTPATPSGTPATPSETGPESDHEAAPGDEAARPGAREPGESSTQRPTQTRRYYDWPEIRRRYVEGVKGNEGLTWPTLEAVAEHFGLAAQRIREKSATEGWRAQRAQWQAQVDAARRVARAGTLAKRGLDLDNSASGVAQVGLQLCQAKLAEIGQRAQAARSAAGPGGGSGGIIDAQEMQRLAAAADVFHKIGLRAIGDPEVTRVELTGPGGQPIEITSELRRDDPSRLTGVLSVLQQAGLGDLFGPESAGRTTLAAQRGADGAYSTDVARR